MNRFRTIWALITVIAVASVASVAVFVVNTGADDSVYRVQYSTSDAKLPVLDPIEGSDSANTVKFESSTESEDTKLEDLRTQFAALVESGDLSQADADAKLQSMLSRTDKPVWSDENFKVKLTVLVESGELTQAEANAKLKAFADGTDKSVAIDMSEWTYETIEAKLAAMVASGEMTREEADKKMAALSSKNELVAKGS